VIIFQRLGLSARMGRYSESSATGRYTSEIELTSKNYRSTRRVLTTNPACNLAVPHVPCRCFPEEPSLVLSRLLRFFWRTGILARWRAIGDILIRVFTHSEFALAATALQLGDVIVHDYQR
jgi:hypothetical protein